MAPGFIERVLEWLGFEPEEPAAASEGASPPPEPPGARAARARRGRVVPLGPAVPTASPPPTRAAPVQVVVCEPRTLEDVQHIAAHLKAERPVLVSLRQAERDAARRIVDFLSGTVYALDGSMRAVGDEIILCTPNQVDVRLEGRNGS